MFQMLIEVGGVECMPEAWLRTFATDVVMATKEATFDASKFDSMMRLVRALPSEVSFLLDNEPFINESLALGSAGCLIGFGTLACREQSRYTRLYRSILRPVREGRRAAQARNKAVFAAPVYNHQGRGKEALAMQGVIELTGVRQPLPSLTSLEVEAVRQGLGGAGLTFQGCA